MKFLLFFLLSCSTIYANNDKVEFWFFVGLDGHKDKSSLFNESVEESLKLLRNNYKLSSSQIHVLKGKGSLEYKACDYEGIKEEAIKIKEAYTAGKQVYVCFFGHALSTSLGAKFLLKGEDPWVHDLEKLFPKGNKENPLSFIFATSSSYDFLKSFSLPGRVMISAGSKGFKNNEPEFMALLPNFFDPRLDLDQDGSLSLTESFLAMKAEVKALYSSQGWMQKEFTILDGDGNGRGTRAPLTEDADLGG